ncbi:MAG TPA: hypothetical protein VJ697_16940 [Nitrososphaeraceae archaeon]|nr:hypothetical protein [Nitrososphaeraceae archaeon]
MTVQINNKTKLDEWMEEMTYVEEHLNKISLSYYNYSISCMSCLWEVSYSESKHLLVIDDYIKCPNCKGEKIRLKNKTSLKF